MSARSAPNGLLAAARAPAAARTARWSSGARERLRTAAIGFALPAALLGVWTFVVEQNVVSRHVLVSPADVLAALGRLGSSGELRRHLESSLMRLAVGFGIGAGLGLAAGIAMGISRVVEDCVAPAFHVVRQVPSIALIPAFILILGVGETLKIVLVAKASFFPVALAALHGIRQIPRAYTEVASVHRVPMSTLIRRLVVPAAAPPIIAGFRIALGRSWLVLVACELMAADSGVGQMMEMARQMFRMDVVLVGVFLTGGIGLLLDGSVRLLERLVLPQRNP